MNAWNYFSRIFCINLDRRPDRWVEAEAELRLCGVVGCERFPAVDRRGTAGCGASHRTLWRRIASGGCGERVLILEDDFTFLTRETLLRIGYTHDRAEVRLHDSLYGSAENRLATLIPLLPERWDLLYLGGSYETAPIARRNKHVVRNRGMHTTHAYAITPRMADLVTKDLDVGYRVKEGSVDGTEHDPDLNIGGSDSILSSLSKREDVFSFTVSPRLFIQRPSSASDINPDAPPGFPWSQVDSVHELMV